MEVKEVDHGRAPVDEEGYVVSFSADEEDKILEFFDKYGFVVIKNAISEEAVEKTLDEIWTCPDLLGTGKIDREDISTWENDKWPTSMGLAEGGFLSHFTDVSLQWSWNNRQSVYKFFALILKREDLWVKFDRTGLMRPTKGIKMKDGSVVDKPHWKTKSNWLHWDKNPWKDPHFSKVQGFVALSDSLGATGGFHCVPGFQTRFFKWQQENTQFATKASLVNVPPADPIRNEIQQMGVRKGSLLIWDSRLPHGNYPNDNDKLRAVQYITFEPATEDNEQELDRRLDAYFVRVGANTDLPPPVLSEIGEKILGLRSWKTGEKVKHTWDV